MASRSTALAVIALGVAMALLALLADTLGIGEEGFGWRRGALLVAGIVVVLAGVLLFLRPTRPPTAPEVQREGRDDTDVGPGA